MRCSTLATPMRTSLDAATLSAGDAVAALGCAGSDGWLLLHGTQGVAALSCHAIDGTGSWSSSHNPERMPGLGGKGLGEGGAEVLRDSSIRVSTTPATLVKDRRSERPRPHTKRTGLGTGTWTDRYSGGGVSATAQAVVTAAAALLLLLLLSVAPAPVCRASSPDHQSPYIGDAPLLVDKWHWDDDDDYAHAVFKVHAVSFTEHTLLVATLYWAPGAWGEVHEVSAACWNDSPFFTVTAEGAPFSTADSDSDSPPGNSNASDAVHGPGLALPSEGSTFTWSIVSDITSHSAGDACTGTVDQHMYSMSR